MKQKTNLDVYLEEQLKDKEFAKRFRKAGEAWDVAIQLVSKRTCQASGNLTATDKPVGIPFL
jgi:hypothetical protein